MFFFRGFRQFLRNITSFVTLEQNEFHLKNRMTREFMHHFECNIYCLAFKTLCESWNVFTSQITEATYALINASSQFWSIKLKCFHMKYDFNYYFLWYWKFMLNANVSRKKNSTICLYLNVPSYAVPRALSMAPMNLILLMICLSH